MAKDKNKTLDNFLDSFDLYSRNVPQLSIEGRKSVYSTCGIICSLVTWIMFAIFLINKIGVMLYGINPIVSTITSIDKHNTPETGIDLEETEFTIAFGVKNYLSGEMKADPSLVQWQASIFET